MGNNLFSRDFNFTDDLDRLLKELEADAKALPSKSFEEFLRDCEKRETANRLYFPVKSQFVKAAAAYRHGYFFAKEQFAHLSLTVGTDGMFQMTIQLDHPLELSCNGPLMYHLIWAIRNTDQFSIYPLEMPRFSLVLRLRLYRVISFST